MIRVVLPPNLRTLAGVGREVQVEVAEPVTQRGVLDALETAYPALLGPSGTAPASAAGRC